MLSVVVDFIDLCFPKEQLSSYHVKSFRKERNKVNTMPNSLLRKINNLRNRDNALHLVSIKYAGMI
jgi:hypothetical protein